MATKKGGKAAAKQRQEVTLSIPDIGLSQTKIDSLKRKFQNEIVSSLGAKMAAIRIIIIKVQRVRV